MRAIAFLCLLLFLTACAVPGEANVASGATIADVDPDALALRQMASKAGRLAAGEATDVVLRQIDTDLATYTFRYTDPKGEIQINVVVPEPASPVGNWEIQTDEVSPLLGQPVERTVDPLALRVGPYRVAVALWGQWPGCTIRSLTLYESDEDGLVWAGFCNTPDGVVDGVMGNWTGEFQASGAPAVPPPSTATPIVLQPIVDPAFASSVLLKLWDEEEQRHELRLVDPATGESVAGYAPILPNDSRLSGPDALSEDGTRLAVVASQGRITEPYAGGIRSLRSADVLHVIDLGAGREKTMPLHGKGWAGPLSFSPDATHLALALYNEPESSTLMIFEADTGQLLAQRSVDFRPSLLTYTQNGATLVVYGQPLGVPPGLGRPGPPRALLADAITLEVLWDRPLETVLSGDWCLEGCSESHGARVFTDWRPAVIPSHDGRRLYIVHADEERLTTVEFDTLTLRSVIIREAQSWLERLLALSAGVAQAKGVNTGGAKEALLSQDGKQLYVVGQTRSVTRDAEGNPEGIETHVGLQVIEVASGRKIASRDIEVTGTWTYVYGIWATPDGAYLVVNGWSDSEHEWTEVLDAKSLERVVRLAEWEVGLARQMDGQPIILARRWPGEQRTESEIAVLDPRSFDIVASWEANASWITMPYFRE